MPAVALCFLLRGHPPSCAHWRCWKCGTAATAGTVRVHYHCDADERPLACGPGCVLARAQRVPSIPTSWGGPGVVRAEAALYDAAFRDPDVACAVLLTDHCAPVYSRDATLAALLQARPMSRFMWSSGTPRAENRFGAKAELQKVVDRVVAAEWVRAAHGGPTRAELTSHAAVVEQERSGAPATNEQNVDEVTCVRRLLRTKGRAWLAAHVQAAAPTLSVFDATAIGEGHHALPIDLHVLDPAFFRERPHLLFARKVRGPPPPWHPLDTP